MRTVVIVFDSQDVEAKPMDVLDLHFTLDEQSGQQTQIFAVDRCFPSEHFVDLHIVLRVDQAARWTRLRALRLEKRRDQTPVAGEDRSVLDGVEQPWLEWLFSDNIHRRRFSPLEAILSDRESSDRRSRIRIGPFPSMDYSSSRTKCFH